jgi:hypothetical protein
MGVTFDDLIPQAPLDFNDLIPKQVPASQDPGMLANAARALRMGIPFGNQIVAATKTLLPEAAGGSKGFDYGANLAQVNAQDAQLQQQHPYVADLGQGTTGALASLAVPQAALGRGAGALDSAVRGSMAGFGLGAAQGAGAPGSDIRNISQTAQNAITGGETGAALGAAFPAASALAGKALPKPTQEPSLTLDNIGAAKNAAYQAAGDLNAGYKPEAFGGLVDKITGDAVDANFNPKLNPRTDAAIEYMQQRAAAAEKSGNPISLTELDQMRQFVNRNVTGATEPSERYFGNQIRSNIDDFIQNAGPDHMASGSGEEAAAAIQNARDLNTRSAKAQALADALQSAGLRAGSTNSGGNVDNATRQNLRRVFEKGNFTPEESDQFTGAIMGGPVQNATRMLGKVLNPSGFVGAGEIAAMLGGHPAGLGAAAIGYGAKKAADSVTQANAQRLMATILAGGQAPVAAPASPLVSQRNALAAALAANANLRPQIQQNSQ